jgi:hypothetical protein
MYIASALRLRRSVVTVHSLSLQLSVKRCGLEAGVVRNNNASILVPLKVEGCVAYGILLHGLTSTFMFQPWLPIFNVMNYRVARILKKLACSSSVLSIFAH